MENHQAVTAERPTFEVCVRVYRCMYINACTDQKLWQFTLLQLRSRLIVNCSLTLISTLLYFAKVRVSSILDSPLGKATVKAVSITDSEEESVAADKGFSSKDK